MCWLRLRNSRHLTVNTFLCLSKVQILRFDIPFLFGVFSCVSHLQCYFTQGKSREKILQASEALWDVDLLHKPQPNISILAMVCHCPIRDKPRSHGLLAHHSVSVLPQLRTVASVPNLPCVSCLLVLPVAPLHLRLLPEQQHSDLLLCNLRR